MRAKLTITYNGTTFLGSQIQKSSPNTINGNIQSLLKELNIDTKVIASGRTDKGVHATGQVIHIDLPPFWEDLNKLKRVMNEMLPSSIMIKNIIKVNDDFHARFGAKKRVYRYIIKDTNSNPFEANLISFYEDIDFNKIQKNIKLFEGEFDFLYFQKTGSEVKSTIRKIYKANAYKHKNFIVLYFEANGFLRSQIRLMVSSLLSLDALEIKEQLELKTKHNVKPAKCNGLYLAKIKY